MSHLLISERPLMVLPSLAQKVGTNGAIVLQHLHAWLSPKSDDERHNKKIWIQNTYTQWHEQIPFLSEATLARTIRKLEGMGLIQSFVSRRNVASKYYTINYEALERLLTAPELPQEDGVDIASVESEPQLSLVSGPAHEEEDHTDQTPDSQRAGGVPGGAKITDGPFPASIWLRPQNVSQTSSLIHHTEQDDWLSHPKRHGLRSNKVILQHLKRPRHQQASPRH